MQNTIEDNFRVWNDDYTWPQDGDKWDGQAHACGQPYPAWKQSVINHLLMPHLAQETVVLKIGRLSKRLVARLSQRAGLAIEAQFQRWDALGEFGVPRYGDWITVLRNQSQG